MTNSVRSVSNSRSGSSSRSSSSSKRGSSSKSANSSKSGSSSKSASNSSSKSTSISSRKTRTSKQLSSRGRSASSSSSMSSSSTQSSKVTKTHGPFQKFHKDQYLEPKGRSKTSSSSSIETIQRKAKFLRDANPPAIAIIARAIRSDRKLGYQLAAYLDKPNSRIQIVLDSITDNDKWRIYADALLASKYKVTAKIAVDVNGQEYFTSVKAETGIIELNPAVRFNLRWERLPGLLNVVTPYAKVCEYIPRVAPYAGINVNRDNKFERQVDVVVALPTQESLNVIMRIPKMTLSKLAVPLPVVLPIERDGSIPALRNLDIRAIVEEWYNDIQNKIRES